MKWLDCNVYLHERLFRSILGSVLLIMVLIGLAPIWLTFFSLYLLSTALFEWDPLYLLMSGLFVVFLKRKEVHFVKKTLPPHLVV